MFSNIFNPSHLVGWYIPQVTCYQVVSSFICPNRTQTRVPETGLTSTYSYNTSKHLLVRPQSLFPLRRVLLFLVCDTVVPHPLGHLSPLLWMDTLHCVLVKTLASRAQHIEPEVSYTKVCTGTGKQCPLFHSLSQEHSRSSWDH